MTEKIEKESDKIVFEDALTLTGFGKYNWFIFTLASGIIVAMAFETFSVAYLVPASACELGTDAAQQGLTAGIPLVGIITSSNFWGFLADTRGRKKILIWSLAMGFTTGALATFSMNWIVLLFLKFASSSSLAGTFALSMSLLGESTPEKQRGTMIVLTSSIYLIATGVMAALTIPILPLTFSYHISFLGIYLNSWRLLNFIYTLPSLFGAIFLIFSYESPKYLLSVGREQECLEVLKRMYSINTGDASDNFKVKSVTLGEVQVGNKDDTLWQSIKAQTVPLFRPPLMKNTLLLSVIFVTVYFCINPFMVWLPNMADSFMKSIQRGETGLSMCEMIRSSQNVTNSEEVNDCTFDQFAMTMILFINLFLSVLNLIMTFILRFCTRKTLLISIQLVCGTAGLCINLSSNYILSAVLTIIFVSGVLNFGFTIACSVDLFPTFVKAMGVCVTLMVGRGSAVLGINLLKYLLVNDCETSFYLYGGIAFCGGICAFFLPSEKKKSMEEEKSESA